MGAWRGLLFFPALLSLGAVVLASCASEEIPPLHTSAVRPLPPPAPAKPMLPPPPPHPARKPVPPTPSEEPAQASGEEPVNLTAPQPPAEATAPEASLGPRDLAPVSTSPGSAGPAPPQTSELIGLDQPAATRLFGPAAERSEEPPATVWRYKTAICELDQFFYLDVRSGLMRTLRYTLRGDGANTARKQECLRSLVAFRRG